jgi:hypothetical protein
MTTIQLTMLVVLPVTAVLFCKPLFRRALALQPYDNPDVVTQPVEQFSRSE